ncbi:MAG TPA: hypothetical protein VJR27_01345 [Candidatus Saccharimonadales bacterium]|nr:hypothetical protein [Candidatus Saccharimonadales bacterium]
MAGCYVEERAVSRTTPISWDIAHHLYARQLRGTAIILTEKPDGMLSATTKQWYKIVRQAEHERSSTLTAARVMELTHEVAAMRHTRFTAVDTEKFENNDVFFMTAEQLAAIPPSCHTLYITYNISTQTLETLKAKMPQNSLLVLYRLKPSDQTHESRAAWR